MATACSSAQACSVVGCISQVRVDVRPYVKAHAGITEIRLCANDSCRTYPPRRSEYSPDNRWIPLQLTAPTGEGEKVYVRVILDGPGGPETASTTTALHVLKPNGPKCSPTCYVADLRLSATGRLSPLLRL